ncbi:MAG: four helix bundle protein [Candidatus Omnitrophota bacterium]|nr:four helix bundle protein [Candidatus Omnitrophota bacterium]
MFNKDETRKEFQKRIYGYIIRLIKFLVVLPKDVVTREITGQLVRSGTSIGANYFEAQGASSKKDYQNYFSYSLKSANESKFWLNVLSDSGLVPVNLSSECRWFMQETGELANIFASSILTMKKQK